MSDFAIVKRTMTDQEIDNYYNGTLDVDAIAEVHCHYDFSEGTGTTIADATGNYDDGVVSGNGTHQWIEW